MTLFSIGGEPVVKQADSSISWRGGMTIDADGSPRAYHPAGSPPGLDYLANAGRPGKWWGIATDFRGNPIIQGEFDPAPGFYVSTTAYKIHPYRHGDPRRELNSEEILFIVVPSQLILAVAPVVLGCRGEVLDLVTEKKIPVVVGDVGPINHLGEGSIALAEAFEIPSDAKRGGVSEKRFVYTIWPGDPAPGFRLQPTGNRRAGEEMNFACGYQR